MLRTIALAALIVAVTLPSCAAPKTASTGPFEFIGFSITDTTGGVGLPRMNEICQTDFERTDARMATTKEYIESTNTAVPPMIAWINPVIIGEGPDAGTVLEFSGQLAPANDMNCKGAWREAIGPGLPGQARGMSVELNGSIFHRQCYFIHLVACSATGQ